MAIVKKYKTTVLKIEKKIEGVYTLSLGTEKKFKYTPGQFLHLTIDDNYDGSTQWPESRCFSIQTSPQEEVLKITYAVKGEYTHKMERELKVGKEIWVKLPYGELFDQIHNKENTVFISGGTGITPYLSLFVDSSFADYNAPILYAGFRNKDLNIYDEAIEQAKKINSTFQIRNIYQDEKGILNIDDIYKENGNSASYFISGPPIMIKTFKQKLIQNGTPIENILTDEWE